MPSIYPNPKFKGRLDRLTHRTFNLLGVRPRIQHRLTRSIIRGWLRAKPKLVDLTPHQLAGRVANVIGGKISPDDPAFAERLADETITEPKQFSLESILHRAGMKGAASANVKMSDKIQRGIPGKIIRRGSQVIVVPPHNLPRGETRRLYKSCEESIVEIKKYNGILFPTISIPSIHQFLSFVYRSIDLTRKTDLVRLSALDLANRIVVLMGLHRVQRITALPEVALRELGQSRLFNQGILLSRHTISEFINTRKAVKVVTTSAKSNRQSGKRAYLHNLANYFRLQKTPAGRKSLVEMKEKLRIKWNNLRGSIDQVFAIDLLLGIFPAIVFFNHEVIVNTCRQWYALNQFVESENPIPAMLKAFSYEVCWKSVARKKPTF